MKTLPSVHDCSIIELPRIHNRSGSITSVNNDLEIPFNTKRVFYLYDIPGGASRGAHAHKVCKQFLIAASGSFDILVDDGQIKRTITLSQPYFGLIIPPMIWAAELNFSSGAICLVLASEVYDENDYIRSYERFKLLRDEKK